jgi:hypothetical protein
MAATPSPRRSSTATRSTGAEDLEDIVAEGGNRIENA